MITLILSGRTTPSRPRDEAMDHLKGVHGPMVYDAPADAGPMPAVYVQNHVVHDFALPDALETAGWDRDLVTEISFKDLAHLRASTSTPYYLDNLKPDEGRFVDQSSVRPLVVTTQTIGDEPPKNPVKLFIYLKASGDVGVFQEAWDSAAARAGEICVRQTINLPLRQSGAPPVFVDGVWSLWFADAAQARDFCSDHLPTLLSGFGAALDHDANKIVLAEEFSVERLRDENTGAQRLEAMRMTFQKQCV